MDPKNIDRGGKAFLVTVGLIIIGTAKKYGPKIVNKVKDIIVRK